MIMHSMNYGMRSRVRCLVSVEFLCNDNRLIKLGLLNLFCETMKG